VLALDRWLRKLQGIYEYSAHPQCLFRIESVRVDEALELADGTTVRAGSRALALHLWNEHLAALGAGRRSVAWVHRVDRAIRRSLSELSGYLAAHPDLQDIRVISGDMRVRGRRQAGQFARIVERYGFEIRAGKTDGRGPLHRFGDGLLIVMLVAVTNPFALRSALFRHHNIRLYLSRSVLTERYPARPHRPPRQPADLRAHAAPGEAGVADTAGRGS
jgi:hypothetical protein